MPPRPDLDPERLAAARLMLLFTPAVVPAGRDPLEVLEAALPHVDVVQVRIKDDEHPARPSPARALYDWTRRVLALARDVPVLVNDRVDVAAALLGEGCAGAHVGQDDLEPSRARTLLGDGPWLGLSTHDARQLVAATDAPVDYVGFGPVHATTTKGYERGKGTEAAWVAAEAVALPVFAIGGITPENADALDRVGRAAVSAGVLAADDPARAAAAVRAALGAERAHG